jgi:hypothetical protein
MLQNQFLTVVYTSTSQTYLALISHLQARSSLAHCHLEVELLEFFSGNSFHIRVIAPLIDVPD